MSHDDDRLPRCIPNPDFLAQQRFVEPAPPGGRKQYAKRKMEPDVTRALTNNSIAKIHPQPNSDAGKRALQLYNIVAFGSAYDARIEKSVSTKKRYGDLCRAAVKIFGFTQREFEAHIKEFLERGVLHTKAGDKRLAPNAFLFGAELRRGTKKRRAEQLGLASSATPSDNVVKTTVQTYKLPDFLADERFQQPPLPDNRKAWRRACSMSSDARTAFSNETKAQFHDDLQSEAAHERFVVFNIVAFGSRFVSGISSLQANQVYYRQLVEAASKMDVELTAVNAHLRFLLEKRILFTQEFCKTRVLTASHFLQSAQLAPDKECLQVDVYERLRLDSTAKIESPEFFGDAKYIYQFDDEHFDRESRFEMPSCDVRDALDEESLRKIDAQYDRQGSSLTVDLFNFVLFGRNSAQLLQDADNADIVAAQLDGEQRPLSVRSGANEVTFGQICRFGFDNGHDFRRLQATLLDLLDRGVLKVHQKRSDNSLHVTAYPFIGTCSRLPQHDRIEQNLATLRFQRARLNVDRRLRIPYEQRLQNTRERMSGRQFTLPENAILDLRGRTHCTGAFGNPCTFGMDGGPVLMDTEDICKDFYVRKLRSGAYTCAVCKFCFKRNRKRSFFNFHNAYRIHTDQSMPVRDIGRAVQKMVWDADYQCALCDAPFNVDSNIIGVQETTEKQPWQPSYNVIEPYLGTRFATVEQFVSAGNVVHLACNFAQNSFIFSEVINLCKIVAHRDRVLHDVGNGIVRSRSMVDIPENVIVELLASAARHGWTKREFLPHLRQILVTPDPMTGLSIGCGTQFDIDLAHYDDLHPLLRLSVDRIDPKINNDHIGNYRVVPRMVNYIMHDFDGSENVFERWRQNIVIKYGQNEFCYEKMYFQIEANADIDLVLMSDDDDDDDGDEGDKTTVSLTKRRKTSSENLFECNYEDCDACFATSARLRDHVYQHHTGERPYKCMHEQCDSAFSTYTGLQKHLQSFLHTRPVQLPCLHRTCNKIFDSLAARDACLHD